MKILKKTKSSTARRIAASVLAAVMCFTYASAAVLGDRVHNEYLTINQNTLLNSSVWQDGDDLQNETWIEYVPGGSVIPIVAYGSKLHGRSTLDYVAEYLEDQGKVPVAGINGDFFEFSTGISMGVVMNEGYIMATPNNRIAVGFKEDGTAVIGDPGITCDVYLGDMVLENVHINKELTATSGPVLYTRDFADTNKATIPNTSVIIQIDEEKLYAGYDYPCMVIQTLQEEGEVTIPENGMLLSVATDSAYTSATTAKDLNELKLSDPANISLKISNDWYWVDYAVGAGAWLLKDGEVQEIEDTTADQITARTAVGLKADGTVVFYTIDGKQAGHSKGVTLDTLARRMLELGCVTAVNLDGGGSTVMAAGYPGYDRLETVTSPSDGTQRMCANYIFLVNTAEATGEAGKLFMYPYDTWMLKGATQKYEVTATDENWHTSEVPIVLSFDGGELGTMDDYGVFTAETAGQGEVRVSSKEVTGKAVVNVVETPHSISVSKENGSSISGVLAVAPAGEVDLTASAEYNGFDLVAADACFNWEVTEGIGTISEEGVFKAAYTDSAVTGSIVVSCGDASRSIQVTVTPQMASGRAVEGFESTATLPQPENSAISATLESDLTKVKYGRSSLKLSYDLSAAGTETPPSAKMNVALEGEPTHLAFWVYGDGQGNALNVITAKADGTPQIHTQTIDFTGWKYITMSLAEGTSQIKGIGMTAGTGGSTSGSIYIDQIIASTGALSDLTGPVISGELSENGFMGTVADAGLTAVTPEDIIVTIDGREIAFDFDNGSIFVDVPADGSTHRLRIVASDACGNLSSGSWEIPGTETSPFADMDGHWANSVVTYLFGQQIVSGINDNGKLVYQPDSEMNREQFAVIMTNWLGTDLAKYADVQLPFEDAEDISWWALDAVKAAYSLGIIKGDSSGGVLNFKPLSSLTRAEAMTIIGRTQEKGFGEASLSGFNDGGEVADWAASYVSALVSQGVVSGSNGSILPSNPVTRSQVAKMLCVLV